MLLRRFYYTLKPYLPWRLRMGMRRLLARRLRRTTTDIWPINPAASRPPAGWPGWPGGKKFAVVLTHDVEGPDGLARCRELAGREQSLGFRSCFNFIPEGTYSVGADLRAWLAEQGFEVGVHDLQHDGRLFISESDFTRKAGRINRYLREWRAEGFRAGFMLRNLEWLHQLDIRYDCSTFDTDPFEPQPEAAGTIFPFWKAPAGTNGSTSSGHAAGGYVELPYTLPQDSTLYLLHQESTNDIWRDKLDWIASHGGMALLNVHPDYLHFGDKAHAGGRTVADHYFDLLDYISRRHAGSYWHALPREMAAFVAQWHSGLLNPAARPS
jgi:hypothetical protein